MNAKEAMAKIHQGEKLTDEEIHCMGEEEFVKLMVKSEYYKKFKKSDLIKALAEYYWAGNESIIALSNYLAHIKSATRHI